MNRPTPPGWAELLLRLLMPPEYRDEHLGDLREGFERRLDDPRAAHRWYRRQTFRSVGPAARLHFRRLRDRRHSDGNGNGMETLKQDLVYGFRGLRKNPTFGIVATLTLALAIAVNTAIFSLVSTIVFADLPMGDPDRLAIVRGVNPELGVQQGSMAPADLLDVMERQRSFASLTAFQDAQWVLTGVENPIRIVGGRISANTTETWSLPPVIGRGFLPEEDQPGAAPVAMLSFPFWQGQYGGDSGVLGETLRLDGTEYTIVGVMHERMGFADFARIDVWVPLDLTSMADDRVGRRTFVTGVLAPGVTHAQAEQELAAIGEALAAEYPDTNAGWGLWAAPVMESLVDDEGRMVMILLVLTVSFVVLIACANIANMLLSRATARAREMSVRAALGAGRWRLVHQLMTESFVISIAAALLGLGLARGLLEMLIRISNGTEQVFMMAELDGPVLGYTLLLAVLAPLAFGLFPALRASSGRASSVLRDGRSTDGGRRGKRARGILVGAQISLALTLMIVAGLISRTVYNITARDLGFDPAGLVTVQLDLPQDTYEDGGARLRFYSLARRAMAEIPSVRSVSQVNAVPGADFGSRRGMDIEGRPVARGQALPPVLSIAVSNEYFDQIGLDLIAGRGFEASDEAEGLPVVVLARSVAEDYWPQEDPIGRRIRISTADDAPWRTIVGVVSDVRSTAETEDAAPNLYLPYDQFTGSFAYLVLRTDAEPTAISNSIRQAIRTLDPNLPVDGISTFEQQQYDQAASKYALLTLFVSFAVLALFMASIGIYGVMSYMVSQRRSEIGLRMALGAERSTVRAMVVKQGSKLLLVGMAFGLVTALALSRLLESLVFGIEPTDPLTFVTVPLVLAAVALFANWVPAMRATRTDPVTALRSD